MENREQLVLDFWKSVLNLMKYQQEHGLPTDYRTVFTHGLKLRVDLLMRIPDLRGVEIDDDLVSSWFYAESPNQQSRRRLATAYESRCNLSASSLEGEEWRYVKDYPSYLVSNYGRIWSLKQRDGLMSPQLMSKGRKSTGKRRLYIDLKDLCAGRSKRYLVHRLVAEAFVPNPNNYPQIDHIDENPQNNRADNLRWCTMEQNLKYYAEKHYVSH